MRSLRDSEDGFTLVEVLVAVALTATVSVALAAAFSVAARTYSGATDRVAGATAAGSLAIHLPPDVQSATDAVASTDGAGISCTGASNPRLELVLGGGVRIVYGLRPDGADWVLERHQCTGGAVTSSRVVARNLVGADAVVPTRTPASGALVTASLQITTEATGGTPNVVTVTGRSRRS